MDRKEVNHIGFMGSSFALAQPLGPEGVYPRRRREAVFTSGPMGAPRGTRLGPTDDSRGGQAQTDSTQNSIGESHWIISRNRLRQTHLKCLLSHITEPSQHRTSHLCGALWNLWLRRPSHRPGKGGGNPSFRMERFL